MKRQLITFAALLLIYSPAWGDGFKWTNANGDMFSLAELKGQTVLVHVWASWCPPCQSELPGFAIWSNQHPDIQIIPVSVDNSIEEAAAFIASKNITMPTLLTDSEQARGLGIRALPTTLIIAADGNISQQYIGSRDWHDRTFIQEITKELHP